MQSFSIKLNKSIQRPAFNIYNNKVMALLDTGALFPVWTADEEILLSQFKAKLYKKNVEFGGFGGKALGDLYIIPILEIGQLIFNNIPIIVSKDLGDVTYSLIISATMFEGLIYEINTVHNYFKITIPDNESNIRNLKIIDNNGRMHILCQSETDGKENIKLTEEDIQANYINTLIKNDK